MSVQMYPTSHSSQFASAYFLPPSNINVLPPAPAPLSDINMNIRGKHNNNLTNEYSVPPGLGFAAGAVKGFEPLQIASRRRAYSLRTIASPLPSPSPSPGTITQSLPSIKPLLLTRPIRRRPDPPPPSPQGNPSGQFTPPGRPRSNATLGTRQSQDAVVSISKFDPFADETEIPSSRRKTIPAAISLPSSNPTIKIPPRSRSPRDPVLRMASLSHLEDRAARDRIIAGVLFDRENSRRRAGSSSLRRTMMMVERQLGLDQGSMYLKSKLSKVVCATEDA